LHNLKTICNEWVVIELIEFEEHLRFVVARSNSCG
jgi:hypothetical protein